MVRMRGSRSMDRSPKGSVWSKRCRKKLKVAKEPPYKLYNAKQGEGSWVTKEILDANDAVIIKGHFNTEEGFKATAVILSESFFHMQYKPEYKPVFRNLGLEDYFSLQPWGVDIQRSWELLTTLDDDGSALLTDLDGKKVKATITEDLIEEALKLKKGEKDLEQMHAAKEKEEVFCTIKGQVNTFQCMLYQDVVAPLRIYMQHFKLLKPERHTMPELRLAFPFTKARSPNAGLSYNFIKHILNDIKQHVKGPNFQKNCHLAAGHMLTRIAYHALGIIGELPPALTASASSSRCVEAFPPKPERQLRGKGKETYEESEDEDEDEVDEENEDEEDQEGDDEGKSKSEGEKESPANLLCLIPFEDPSLDEIYKNEERRRLERACDMASKKRKRNQEEHKKPEPAWKERSAKDKEASHFVQKFDTDMEGMAPHIAALLREHLLRQQLRGKEREENELCTAIRSSQSKEQEGEQPKTEEQDEKLNLQGIVTGSKEKFKEDSSTLGKGSMDTDPRRHEDRKDAIELLDVTSHKTPHSEVILGLTGQSGRVDYAEALPETKSDPEEAFDPMASPQKTQESKEQVEEAKEVCKENANEEANEEGATEEEEGQSKAKKEEVKELQSKPDGWEERNEKVETEEKKVVSTLQMQAEGQLVPWEKAGKLVKNELCSECPSVQVFDIALDKGKWLEQSTSQESELATHRKSQLPLQGISSRVLVGPVETVPNITINMNDSDEMLDNIVGLLQRYKSQTTVFKDYSAMLAAQAQLIQQLHAEKEDLAAKHMLVVEKLSMAEAQLSDLQAKYRHQEEQRKSDQVNFDKFASVHFATLQRLDNANKVLDQLAQYPLSFVKDQQAEESTVVRSMREHSTELANQLATERLMRNTLATAFKDKESEMRRKIESLEKELLVEKLKLQSEPLHTEKSKVEQLKNFPIDLNMLDSGEASSSHIEHQPIYISSEGSQKEEM